MKKDGFYIQFKPKNAKLVTLEKFADCKFLQPLNIDEFMVLLEEKAILDVKIDTSFSSFLILKETSRPTKNEKIRLNDALFKYCHLLKIYTWRDVMKEEGKGEQEI